MEDPLAKLVEMAKTDCDALLKLYEKMVPLIRKWSYKMRLVDYASADWEQEAFVMLEYALKHYKASYGVAFAAYFRMVLYRKGLECMKKSKDCLLFEGDESQYLMPDESVQIEADVIHAAVQEEQSHYLKIALQELGKEEYEIIWLFYFEEKNIGDIARLLGKSYDSIECKKRRILTKLKKRLQQVTEKETIDYIQ